MADIQNEVMLINGASRGASIRSTIVSAITKIRDDITAFKSAIDLQASELDAILDDLGGGEYHSSEYYTGLVNAMKTVGDSAFANNKLIRSVSMPGVTSIGSAAFLGCVNLLYASFPAAVTIGNDAFAACSRLTEFVGSNVTIIGSSAFYFCNSLSSVNFLNVTSIGAEAFRHCINLSQGSFPALTAIGSGAFSRCDRLTSLYAPAVTSVSDYAFADCGALTGFDFTNVSSIGKYAFYACRSLTSVVLGSSVTVVPSGCFGECTMLSSVVASNVTSIYERAFGLCPDLKVLSFPAVRTMIASDAFSGCRSVSTIYMPEYFGQSSGGFSWFQSQWLSTLRNITFGHTTLLVHRLFSGYSLYSMTFPKLSSMFSETITDCTIDILNVPKVPFIWLLNCSIKQIWATGLSRLENHCCSDCSIDAIYLNSSAFTLLPVPLEDALYNCNYRTVRFMVPSSLYSMYQVAQYWSDHISQIYSV